MFFHLFFIFIGIQYLVLVGLLFVKGFAKGFYLSDSILMAYMTSIFVETLSAIFVMIKYAFNSDQEVKLIGILNNAISNYKKFTGKRR